MPAWHEGHGGYWPLMRRTLPGPMASWISSFRMICCSVCEDSVLVG